MTKGYLELVGLQVAFDTVVPRYRLVNYYRRTIVPMERPVMTMRGYDLDRIDTAKNIADSLRKAYAPALLSEWAKATIAVNATYFQFQPGARPDEIELEGEWHILE